MINNPESLTQQLLNLVERVATEMRVLGNTLSAGLSKKLDKTAYAGAGSESKPIYFDEDGNPHVVTSFAGNASSASKATLDAKGNDINEHYLSKRDAENTYLKQGYTSTAESTYLSKTDASKTYATKTDDVDMGSM